LHLPNYFCDDALKRATPTRMNSGDGASPRINKKDGNAVCGLDAEEQANTIGDGGVSAASIGRGRVEEANYIRMELLEGNEREIVCAESRLETAAVFQDSLP